MLTFSFSFSCAWCAQRGRTYTFMCTCGTLGRCGETSSISSLSNPEFASVASLCSQLALGIHLWCSKLEPQTFAKEKYGSFFSRPHSLKGSLNFMMLIKEPFLYFDLLFSGSAIICPRTPLACYLNPPWQVKVSLLGLFMADFYRSSIMG